jgi:hypothetical protein
VKPASGEQAAVCRRSTDMEARFMGEPGCIDGGVRSGPVQRGERWVQDMGREDRRRRELTEPENMVVDGLCMSEAYTRRIAKFGGC